MVATTSSYASHIARHSGPLSRSVELNETGLVFGLGTRLAPMARAGKLAVEPERVLALLSVAARRPVSTDVIRHVEAAAGHWQRGDKALANLRLVFAGLPRLHDAVDAQRLQLADGLLDAGLTPRSLMTELGLDPACLDLAKAGYNPNQPRVPAGNDVKSGRWEEIWTGIKDWFEQPVPVYDQDTGLEVGTQSRGRAIATNPVTIGVATTAALFGGEVLVGGAAVVDAAATVDAAMVETAEETGIAANAARGLPSEARVLRDLGLPKNTQSVMTVEGRSVPDALTDELSVEIKDAARINLTKQLRIQTDAASSAGRRSILVTGNNTRVSKDCAEVFYRIIRRSDLGPR